MSLHNILFGVLLSILTIVKGQHNLLNISIGILNAQTVIACGSSIRIYSSFIPTQILSCPYVIIQEDNIRLIRLEMNEEELNQLEVSPKLMIKLTNNSFIHSSNITQFNTYYLLFSSELTCRYSVLQNTTICFYYPSSINFIDIENRFDKNLLLPTQTNKRFIMIFINIIGILILIICLIALYILCTSRAPYQHRIHLDHIIDPQLARQAALKLAPEPV